MIKWLEFEKKKLVDDEHESKISMCLIYYLLWCFAFGVWEQRGERESRMEAFSSKAFLWLNRKTKEGPIFSLSEIHIQNYVGVYIFVVG